MQVVAKTPHINIRIEGEIPEIVLNVLKAELGDELHIRKGEDEYVDVTETDWYKGVKLIPGEALRHYREMHSLTQSQIGEKLGGIPRQHISNMEKGRRAISVDMAKKLAAILNTTPVHFLDI
jgi:DNA-binding XRE family transcriptional regulator